jgi:hypothetical protein
LIKRPAGALAGMAMILLLVAPAAAAATRLPRPPGDLFDVPRPAVPALDVVREMPGEAGARIAATASSQRYSIDDGSDDTIAVSVTSACEQECTAADPQAIADTVGTFIHGAEVDLLTVQMDTPFQLGFDCGFEAESCYFGGENKIVLSGDEEVGTDGASREYVLAHEYGHHVAQHRQIPAPFGAAINWGTERWSSYEHVCQGHREGALFPGDEGSHYYEDPGEAFAESFAHNRFPDAPVAWSWVSAPPPSRRFAATPSRLGRTARASPSAGGCRSTAPSSRNSAHPSTARSASARPAARGSATSWSSATTPARRCAAPARASASATASTTRSAASRGCGSPSSTTAGRGGAST